MGLDAVELVIRFEEEFNIIITDEEAEKCTTHRKVIDLVLSKVEVKEPQYCLSQRAFHLLRREFAKELALERRGFRLSTHLADIVPQRHRKRIWKTLSLEVGAIEWPDLARPIWVHAFIWSASGFTFVYALVITKRFDSTARMSAILVASLAALLCGCLGVLLTRPLKLRFPKAYSEVKDLVRFVIAKSPETIRGEEKAWTREQIASVVHQVILEEIGITDFTEDSRFVEDMGIG